MFAKTRADASQRGRQHEVIRGDLRRSAEVCGGDARDEAGDVESRGASGSAGSDAVAHVIRQKEFQRHLPGGAHFVGVGVDHHAIGHRCRAGRRQVFPAFYPYCAQKTGRGRRKVIDVAEGRNPDREAARCLKNRKSLFNRRFPPVNL